MTCLVTRVIALASGLPWTCCSLEAKRPQDPDAHIQHMLPQHTTRGRCEHLSSSSCSGWNRRPNLYNLVDRTMKFVREEEGDFPTQELSLGCVWLTTLDGIFATSKGRRQRVLRGNVYARSRSESRYVKGRAQQRQWVAATRNSRYACMHAPHV